MADLPNGHPGCLIASICYQERLFDREVRALTAQSVEELERALPRHPRRDRRGATRRASRSTLEDVADMLSCVVDGGIIMSKALNDPRRLERQVLAFRSFVKLLFAPAARQAMPHPAVAAE